ncbi:hypothetical protein CWS02_11140 [Enterobacter sp. EA-1]|nr:hypothetical protein CWS02_11140 [Enterobacter sp. EA-1]
MIVEKQPPLVVLEAGGVGYEVHMPMTCFYELPDAGKEAIVFTHFVVREDAQLLFGFNNKQERTLFRELIKPTASGRNWRWRSSLACRRSSLSTRSSVKIPPHSSNCRYWQENR